MRTPPTIDAYSTPTATYVPCEWCGDIHSHGPGDGHVVTHCPHPEAPPDHILQLVGPWSAELERAFRKRYSAQRRLFRRWRYAHDRAFRRPPEPADFYVV